MNWLAHILLSKRDVEYQIGNFLADPLKGKAWDSASAALKQGMTMHKGIDVFTDSHEIVLRSKARLGEKGYLKGVVIDLLYDHFLSLGWELYSSLPQAAFLGTFYSGASLSAISYPDEVKHIVTRLVESDRLSQYQRFDGFVGALHRVDARLSPRIKAKDSPLNYIATVEREYTELQADFEAFFPELMEFFKCHELGCENDNYLI